MKQMWSRHYIARYLVLYAVVIIGIFVGFQQLQPPSPPSESSAHGAAYQRMLTDLKAMTAEPHPSGSSEIASVREYIVQQIRHTGLEPTIQAEAVSAADIEAAKRSRGSSARSAPRAAAENNAACNEGASAPVCEMAVFDSENKVVLQNILVKLDSPKTEEGVLVMAHYDTKPDTPGAADDMAGVAAMLEAMRERSDDKNELNSDIYFLFTDGEELGAMGARAFVKTNPTFKSHIKQIVNLEARGTRGGLIMFETSEGGYNLVREFADVASRPISFSFLTSLYRQMPNGTDLTMFLDAGYPGLNFAIAQGVENYHHASDNFENLDRGSAYHFLLTTLELTAQAAQKTPVSGGRSSDNGTYFMFLPGNLVVLQANVMRLLAVLAGAGAAAWVTLNLVRRQIRIKDMVSGAGWLGGMMMAVGGTSWLTGLLLTKTLNLGESSNTELIFYIQSALTVLGVLLLFAWRARTQTFNQAIAGVLPIQVVGIVAASVWLPSIAYLFVLPVLITLGVSLLSANATVRVAMGVLASFVLLIFYVPVCWLVYVLGGLSFAPIALGLDVLPLATMAALQVSALRIEQK